MRVSRVIIYFIVLELCVPCFRAEAQWGKNRKPVQESVGHLPDSAGFIDAVAKYNEGRYAEAAAILGALDQADDAVNYYLGLSEFAMKDIAGAEMHLKAAVAADSTNFWYRYRLASLYAMTERPELTEVIYEKLLKDFPKKSELYYDLVDLYVGQNKLDKALETLTLIETEFGRSDATAMTRFTLLGRQNRQREAYESLEEFNREFSSPQVLAVLGDYQMSMYNDSTALKYYEEALDIAPEYAPALLGKAETYRMTRRYDDYFRTLDKFMSDKDISPLGKSDYLRALIQRSDPNFLNTFRDRLDSTMTVCISAHPKDSSMLTVAGVYFYGTDRKEQAGRYFYENMLNWPSSISVAVNYVESLMYSQDWETLSGAGREAFARFPKELAFLEMASFADYNLKEYDKVLETCDFIVSSPIADSARVISSYSTMGDVYHLLGDNAKAYKAYDKALKINPDYVPVLNNYAYYLSMDGKKLNKAYAMSRKTIEKEPDNSTYLDTFAWILYLQGKPLEAKPFFKHAMLYGGKDSAVVLDHYAEVLYALKEYDLAFVYWKQAQAKNDGHIPDLDARIRARKSAIK